ncbi:DHHA1 domain-containing protein [Alkalihalophilus pseudofirmus]|uniref:alanyl-tRNA editing protein n=1 Tax=Alkalihalophilus pseudofirmus TaxID=79885 RepID=UPI00259BDCB6|nr:DHHA1 domain-containing protein [Alkalihalophilus pseudofirmus]WEG15355.1 DHHA1 domain-containing protein [Alkalihalophilus pseudofirmus]
MTTKLYYESAYLTHFEASVIKKDTDEQGDYIVLNQTAFYPTGGGQSCDKGLLDDVNVNQVEEIEEEIRHYIENSVFKSGQKVHGQIDWNRRFDHMQQHAGQHILSAAFAELFGYQTVGFHLGSEEVTVDIEVSQLTTDEAEKAVHYANEMIQENRAIEARWVSEEEANRYPLRKELSVKGDIRLVIIPDFDYNGCGGTHPKQTLEVQGLSITGWEKQRNHIRVSFLCGNRVFRQFTEQNQILQKLSQTLNAPSIKLPEKATSLIVKQKELDKELEQLKGELFKYEAIELLDSCEVVSNQSRLFKHFEDRSIKELQQLAKDVVEENDQAVVFFVSETAEKTQLVMAVGKAVNSVQANMMMKKVLPYIDGRGGGNQHFAQGGGNKGADVESLFELVRELF